MKRIFLGLSFIVLLFSQGNFDEKDPREIIEKVRIYKLTEALDLTTEQAAKFFPRLKEMRKTEQEFQRERIEIIQKLKQMLKEGATEQEISKVLDRYSEIHKKKMERHIKEIGELKEILTPSQQAKFLIFQEEFEKEIRDLIKEVRKRHPRPDE
uniref:Periplasmic heavy metal sensor n=1 Tax=candidate division WOR-3 bacterium TaxID=2052148 RepID=A0A7C4TH48_UNCW3